MRIISAEQLFAHVMSDVERQLGEAIAPREVAGISGGFALNEAVHGQRELFFEAPLPVLAGAPEPVAAVVWTYAGVHVGPLFDAAPTDRPVVVAGVTLVRVDDGQVLRTIDWLGVATQIGMSLTGRSTRDG